MTTTRRNALLGSLLVALFAIVALPGCDPREMGASAHDSWNDVTKAEHRFEKGWDNGPRKHR